jgi:hypothetical protein
LEEGAERNPTALDLENEYSGWPVAFHDLDSPDAIEQKLAGEKHERAIPQSQRGRGAGMCSGADGGDDGHR